MISGYSKSFYTRREKRVVSSADALVPLLMRLLQPASVLDVGCANGLWLDAFKEAGVREVCGIDGPWVPSNQRRISDCEFVEHDFGQAPPADGLDLPRVRYDILICLELLEHLSEHRADDMVEWLCSKSDTLIVSAAAPQQGGTGHKNEQWPAYWAAKFRDRGFVPFDFLRYAIWTDERIAPWYRQNIIGYFRAGVPANVRRFSDEHVLLLADAPMPLSHPGVHAYKLGRLRRLLKNPFREGLKRLKEKRNDR